METPNLPDLIKRWKVAHEHWNAMPEDTPEQQAAWRARHEVSMEICATKPTTIEGVKVLCDWMMGELFNLVDESLCDDFKQSLRNLQFGIDFLNNSAKETT